MPQGLDVLIRGGRVLDGSGTPWRREEIGVQGGRIGRVGCIREDAAQVIEAEGMVVCPGFVDLHTHNDLTALPYPDMESYIMQGVTTVAGGNCGLSMAPLNPDAPGLLKDYLAPFLKPGFDHRWTWKTLREYYRRIEEQGIALNIAPLVGQGSIRLAVKGFSPGEPSGAEMKAMKRLLEESLEDGAFGMSSGLIYPPGSHSSTDELIELASVLGGYHGLYATHIRNEGNKLIEAVEEAIQIGEESEVPVEIAHHKAAGKENWGKVHATLRLMQEARERGVEIDCDVYPYTAGSTTITAVLPSWLLEGGVTQMLRELRSKVTRDRVRGEIAGDLMRGENLLKAAGWDNILIGACPARPECEGRSLKEILGKGGEGADLYERFFDWLLDVEANASMLNFVMHEDDMRTVMRSPLSSIVSDGWATAPRGGGKPHPRVYGTFPRVLGKYVRDEGLLRLEEAVRKMTCLPASKLRLKDRGLIREGFWADLVVFDPAQVADQATYSSPHEYPRGINYVLVNGELVVKQGQHTGGRPGKVLRRT